ncbi:hypothetical protein ABBQ38_003330 [Trebouxia sp. C0009 RCD-2024]
MQGQVLAQTPACRLASNWSAKHSTRLQRHSTRRYRDAFTGRAQQYGVVKAEQSSRSGQATARTEKQADDKATQIKEESEAAGEAVEIEKQGNELRVTKAGGEQIYIGFEKGDKDRSGSGRIIEDDPSRYPDRTQTTGGWSGGEKGLAAFIEEEQKKMSAKTAVVPKDQEQALKEGRKPQVISQDGDTIYIGFEKGDAKKPGEPGRYIQDDPRKYPNKENLGPFGGVTGGFAGGEAGLQQFVQEGEIKFKDPNATGSNNFNILAFAGLLAIATTVGGVLLTDAVDLGEFELKQGASTASAQLQQLTSAPIEGNSKLLLEVVAGLFGVTATGAVLRTAFRSVAGKVTRGSLNVAKLAIFWTGVFVSARFILESN